MFYLVGNSIFDSKDCTYLNDKDCYITFHHFCDEVDGVVLNEQYCVDKYFNSDEIIRQSENVFDLLNVGDLVYVNGYGGNPYPNGIMWIPFIVTQDCIDNQDEYFVGWSIIRIYKSGRHETFYRLVYEIDYTKEVK